MFQRLWKDGCDIDGLGAEFRMSRTCVYPKSRQLGLRKDIPKTIFGKGGKPKCLKCRRPFPSKGNHNRICDECKISEVWENNDGFGSYMVHEAAIKESGVSGEFEEFEESTETEESIETPP